MYQHHTPQSGNPAHTFYSNVIEKVMERMDPYLATQGFDVEQIESFSEKWTKNTLQFEEVSDDETEETAYPEQYPDYDQPKNLLTQHIESLNSQPYGNHSLQQYPPQYAQQQPSSFHENKQQFDSSHQINYSSPSTLQTAPPPSSTTQTSDINNVEEVFSSDDDDDDLSEENQNSDSIMLCLFKNVRHAPSKHRCDFLNCVIRYNHKEYFYGKCTGEFKSP
ncbi:Uncharacterized protein QTN25_000400 [Entamoeba marina]